MDSLMKVGLDERKNIEKYQPFNNRTEIEMKNDVFCLYESPSCASIMTSFFTFDL